MKDMWNCPYCETSNPVDETYCRHCHSKYADRAPASPQKPGTFEERGLTPLPPAPPAPFDIPRPGEMLGRLFHFSDEALSGSIPSQRFAARLKEMLDMINSTFFDVYGELENLADDDLDYRDSVIAQLEFSHFMFKIGIQEMMLFASDSQASHVIFGRMLVQRAELEYIHLMERLASDAAANPFTGECNILGRLASEVISGRMGTDEYAARVTEYEEIITRQVEDARTLISSGLSTAKRYDGTEDEVLAGAIEKLKGAENLLSKAIINLCDPDEIGRSVRKVMERGIDDSRTVTPAAQAQ